MQQDQHFPSTPQVTPLKAVSNIQPSHLKGQPPSRMDLTTPGSMINYDSEGVVYGTTIKVGEVMREIRHFLVNFSVAIQTQDDFITQKPYVVKLSDFQRERSTKQTKSCVQQLFEIDAAHLHKYSKELYLQLIYHPPEITSLFDLVIQSLFQKEFIESQTDIQTIKNYQAIKKQLKVSFFNLQKHERYCVKDLGPKFIGQLIELTGIVVRASEIIPEMKVCHFLCFRCKQEVKVQLVNARVQQPKRCQKCKQINTFELMHNLSSFTNKQYIKFQQLLQNISQGRSPASTTLISYDSNVDKVQPGDCIKIVGIYRCSEKKVCKRTSINQTIFNTYIDVISLSVLEGKNKRIKVGQQDFNEEQKNKFMKISCHEKIIDHLAQSFAPSIFGHKQIKKGLLAQLFGGYRHKKGQNYRRSQINICLVGDPSTAKSQLLQQVNRVAPRSVYTCGRGSTSAGLTANVRKDPQTKDFVLESGALVLSDQGICCIDQFDKMNPKTHTTLLEVMQQQTISIAKAGIVCQLNSRTAILAAANPINSRYDIKKSVIENINMPPALLSRFDLIYIMLDIADSELDRKIARHILNIYSSQPKSSKKKHILDTQMLADYISFARQVQPTLSQGAARKIQEEYLKLRNEGQSVFTITATPRMLESLIRMSEAFAKMRLSTQVTVEDAQQAIELLNFATIRAATDPESGIIDIGMLSTGKSNSWMNKIRQISEKLKIFMTVNEAKYSKATEIDILQQDFKQDNVSKDELKDALKLLESNNYLHIFMNHRGKKTFKLHLFE